MNALIPFLQSNGLMLLIGASLLLAAGLLLTLLQQSPIHRQRAGEVALACTLLWLILACIPMHRFQWSRPITSARATPAIHPQTPPLELRETDLDTINSILVKNQPPRPITPPAPQTPAPESALIHQPINFKPILPIIYLTGVLAVTIFLIVGQLLLALTIHRAQQPPDWLIHELTTLSPRRPSRLLISHRCWRPISCGLFRPLILLPADCALADNLPQIRQILRHELAHIRQRDAVGHCLLQLGLILFYFHPFYWLLRSRIELSRELVADDLAAESDKESYICQLIALARSRPAARLPALAGIPIFKSTTIFYRRMHMLMQRNQPLASRCSSFWRFSAGLILAAALIAATGLAGVRRAIAQPKPAAADDKPAAPAKEKNTPEKRDEAIQSLKARIAELEALGRKQEADELKAAAFQLELVEATNAKVIAELERARREAELAKSKALYNAALNQAAKAPPAADDPRRTGQNAIPDLNALAAQPRLDLVGLAMNYIDATGATRLAESRLSAAEKRFQQKVISEEELVLAKTELDIARRKQAVLKGITDLAYNSAKIEYQRAQQMYKSGTMSATDHDAAMLKLNIMELILNETR